MQLCGAYENLLHLILLVSDVVLMVGILLERTWL